MHGSGHSEDQASINEAGGCHDRHPPEEIIVQYILIDNEMAEMAEMATASHGVKNRGQKEYYKWPSPKNLPRQLEPVSTIGTPIHCVLLSTHIFL